VVIVSSVVVSVTTTSGADELGLEPAPEGGGTKTVVVVMVSSVVVIVRNGCTEGKPGRVTVVVTPLVTVTTTY
jgi:hypothetical protein